MQIAASVQPETDFRVEPKPPAIVAPSADAVARNSRRVVDMDTGLLLFWLRRMPLHRVNS
jgi:hypothetical protein